MKRTLLILALLVVSHFGIGEAGKLTPGRTIVKDRYRIDLDLSGQVLRLVIPEERGYFEGGKTKEAPIYPTLSDLSSGEFVSASVLAQKAKQFDDGLYAAVDLAAQKGEGPFPGKKLVLTRLIENSIARDPNSFQSVLDIVLGAAELGGLKPKISANLAPLVSRSVEEFRADPLQSKAIGFYTWSRELESIFQQDRMLQKELRGKAGIEALVKAIRNDGELRATYEGYLALIGKLTNPLVKPDLRPLLLAADKGKWEAPSRGMYFFPPSMAHETELIKKLFGNRPIPEGFNLAEEMIKRIRRGELKLTPTKESGWYDHQTWALEPLVIPEKMPEGKHLKLEETYTKQLLELFKGIIALTRETHIKQLEIPAVGAGLPDGHREKRPVIDIYPELSAEPLPTFYLRRALAYRFVRAVIEETFGKEGLKHMHRVTSKGPVKPNLADELSEMENLFLGAHIRVSHQLGMSPEPSLASDRPAETFEKWSRSLAEDPDIGQDARMMVPVFYDIERKKTKVWAFLGWTSKRVSISFEMTPVATVTDTKTGKKADGELRFHSTSRNLAYPVTAEVYVEKILNREEFRKLCDTYKTQSEILIHLATLPR
ncbi:MAG: hypothetical protein HYU64_02980 [Armatimonadetes bacterium]|nr:hypothetical protein [Armatimonadota bacterium]